jgi:hypothetical protein
MKKVKTLQSRGLTYQTTPSGNEVKIKMTVKYSRVNASIPNIVVTRTAPASDLINAWWAAVERSQIKDPNVLCLSKDPEAYDIQDEEGDPVYPEE